MSELAQLLATLPVSGPLPFDLNRSKCLRLDLSGADPELADMDTADTPRFGAWISQQLAAHGALYAAGGYGENRELYRMSSLFESGAGEARTLHLGIDLWLAAGTPVHAVLGGRVHSLADNARFGDYGPTVILEHEVLGQRFHTLYGHLARRTLTGLREGQQIESGAAFGWLGEPGENLGWPPHLHFQVIGDIGSWRGDYPGVCKPSEGARWLASCPDPNLLLRIGALR